MEKPDFTKYNNTISPSGATGAEPIPMYTQYQVKMLVLAAIQFYHDVHFNNVEYDINAFFEYYNLDK